MESDTRPVHGQEETYPALQLSVEGGPAYEVEPFYLSIRFWVAVLTPIVSVAMAALVQAAPIFADVSDLEVVTFIAGAIVSMITYLVSRTWRNHDPTALQRVAGAQLLEVQKEPFFRSSRFWVAVLTPIVAMVIAALSDQIPSLATLNPAQVAAVMAGFILSGSVYVLVRGYRGETVTPPVI